MNNSQEIKRSFWSRQAVCPRWWEFVLAGIWLVAMAWVSSNVYPEFLYLFYLLLGGVALAGIWFLRLIVAFIRIVSECSDLKRTRMQWIAWCIVPLIGLSGAVLLKTKVTFALRFHLSREALQTYVEAMSEEQESELTTQEKQWVGFFYIQGVHREQNSMILVTGFHIFDDFGLAYLPKGSSPPEQVASSLQHLSGSWYKWRSDFVD